MLRDFYVEICYKRLDYAGYPLLRVLVSSIIQFFDLAKSLVRGRKTPETRTPASLARHASIPSKSITHASNRRLPVRLYNSQILNIDLAREEMLLSTMHECCFTLGRV